MKTTRLWGYEKISLNPTCFNFLRLKYALKALDKSKGTFLEVGGGAGAFTRAISYYRPDVKLISTDIDAKLINSARLVDKNNEYKLADVEKLPFKSNIFDAALSFDVIEHLDSPNKALDEMFRVLNSGGVFHSAIPLEGSIYTIHGLMAKLGIKPKEEYAGHINRFSAYEVIDLLRKSGFKNITCEYSGHFMAQITDFAYFLGLNLFGSKPDHTVEGFIESLHGGLVKSLLIVVRDFLGFIFFVESTILRHFPGQIGHFTAIKNE